MYETPLDVAILHELTITRPSGAPHGEPRRDFLGSRGALQSIPDELDRPWPTDPLPI